MNKSKSIFTSNISRKKMLGSMLLGTGTVFSGLNMMSLGRQMKTKGKILINTASAPKGLEEAVKFPLVEALYGRRARRFSKGAELPDGPLKYKSQQEPQPLDELEQMLLLTAAGGNTGWHNMIYRHERYAPHLSNYSGSAGGRTFPSAAGFHTSNFFYTDDNGVYYFPTRDSGSLVEHDPDGAFNLDVWLESHKNRIVKLADGRLNLPPAEPYMEGHNTWCVNRPGSTFLIPVADLAQHQLLILCFLVQNGYCLFDDYKNEKVKGMEKFRDLVDVDNPYPLSFVEQYTLTEGTAELSTSCYAGMLMLQALGLGGWMFDGVDRYSVLGASGDPDVPGLGFRYDTDDRWALPNVTGLPGYFEGFCPPHYPDMRAAVDAVVERKFGNKGPYDKSTSGPWKESSRIRSSAQMHDEKFKDCVATMAQHIYDSYGKFPGTVPTIFILTYLQAHHLDLEFYDTYFQTGSYLETQARHQEWWHNPA